MQERMGVIAVAIWSQNKWNRSVDTEDGSVASVFLLVGDKMRVKKKKKKKRVSEQNERNRKMCNCTGMGDGHVESHGCECCTELFDLDKTKGTFFFF